MDITLIFVDTSARYSSKVCHYFDTIKQRVVACNKQTCEPIIALDDPEIGLTKDIFDYLLNEFRIRKNNKWLFGIPKYGRQYEYLGGVPVKSTEPLRIGVLRKGDLALVSLVYDARERLQISEYEAREVNSAAVMEYLLEHHNVDKTNGSICAHAAARGDVDYLRFLHDNGFAWYEDTPAMAARNGCAACLEYAIREGCEWDCSACLDAALYGHMDCVRFLLEVAHKHKFNHNDESIGHDDLGISAAASRNVALMAYLRQVVDPRELLSARVCAKAAECGDVKMLEHLRTAIMYQTMTSDTTTRDVSTHKMLEHEPCAWDGQTTFEAICNGHMECLKFALASNPPCPLDINRFEDRIYACNYECAIYALEHCITHDGISIKCLRYCFPERTEDTPARIRHAILHGEWSECGQHIRALVYITANAVDCFEAIFPFISRDNACTGVHKDMFICALHHSEECLCYLVREIPYNTENEKYWPLDYISVDLISRSKLQPFVNVDLDELIERYESKHCQQ